MTDGTLRLRLRDIVRRRLGDGIALFVVHFCLKKKKSTFLVHLQNLQWFEAPASLEGLEISHSPPQNAAFDGKIILLN